MRAGLTILQNAKRILIIGSPGSGKTIFAKQLALQMNLTLFSLDDYCIQNNWHRTPAEDCQQILTTLLTQPEWIIEGNYADTLALRLQHAQLVLFLDTPTYLCLFRVTLRGIKRLCGDRESLPNQVKIDSNFRSVISISKRFVKLVLFYKSLTKPKMESLIKNSHVHYIVIGHRKLKDWLQQLNFPN